MATDPGHPRPSGSGDALERALLALRSDRPNEAERMAGEVLKTDSRNARALHIFGCAVLMQGRAQEAITPLEAAARERHDPEVETKLAIALRRVGRDDDALVRLKRATRRSPPYAPAYLELGYLFTDLERYDDAIDTLRRGLDVAPMLPEFSIQLGYVFLRCRNIADAKVAFARAVGISPDHPGALFGLAKAHQELGETEAAVTFFRRCLPSRPNDAGIWLDLGHCLLELGQLDAGYDCFRAAARGDPRRYGNALASLVTSGRGRFWLKPTMAAQYFRGPKS
jgi:Flp pilus assembly protein TadD